MNSLSVRCAIRQNSNMPVDDTGITITDVTTQIKTEDGSIVFVDSVTTENSNEASSIETLSSIITNCNILQDIKKERKDSSAARQATDSSSCRKHSFAPCNSSEQNLRRSSRLVKKCMQKETGQKSNTHVKKCMQKETGRKSNTHSQGKKQTDTAKRKKKISKNSQQNCRKETEPNLLNIPIRPEPTTSCVARNPERVLGVTTDENGKKHIMMKWTDGTSNHIPEENLTPETKRLLFLFYRAELLNLKSDIYPTIPIVAEESQNDLQVGNTNNDDHSSVISDHISEQSHVNDCPPEIDTEMHNISEFRKQQKQYLKENPPPANMGFDDPDIDLKMDF